METIDVHDLPEPMARAIADTVEHLRQQLTRRNPELPTALPVWSLGVRGDLTREEIYDHLDGVGGSPA